MRRLAPLVHHVTSTEEDFIDVFIALYVRRDELPQDEGELAELVMGLAAEREDDGLVEAS